MTLLAVLTANETSRFEGGIALSGYVPLLDHIKSVSLLYLNRTLIEQVWTDHTFVRTQMASPASREIPLFWGHGQDDPYLTFVFGLPAPSTRSSLLTDFVLASGSSKLNSVPSCCDRTPSAFANSNSRRALARFFFSYLTSPREALKRRTLLQRRTRSLIPAWFTEIPSPASLLERGRIGRRRYLFVSIFLFAYIVVELETDEISSVSLQGSKGRSHNMNHFDRRSELARPHPCHRNLSSRSLIKSRLIVSRHGDWWIRSDATREVWFGSISVLFPSRIFIAFQVFFRLYR